MMLLIFFHQPQYRDFKTYFNEFVSINLPAEFPPLVSYNRFVELTSTVVVPFCVYLPQRLCSCSGLSFIDSTPLPVCHNRRIHRYRVFTAFGAHGKTSMCWFYEFKLHLAAHDQANGYLSASRQAISMIDSPCHT